MRDEIIRCDICDAVITKYEPVYRIKYRASLFWRKVDVCDYCMEQVKQMAIESRKAAEGEK